MPDGLFKLRTKESPGPSELAPGEDAAPRVLLHGVGLQVEQRRDVGDRQDILARDAHTEEDSSLITLITLLSISNGPGQEPSP